MYCKHTKLHIRSVHVLRHPATFDGTNFPGIIAPSRARETYSASTSCPPWIADTGTCPPADGTQPAPPSYFNMHNAMKGNKG